MGEGGEGRGGSVMSGLRVGSVIALGVGVMLVSVALGLLYRDQMLYSMALAGFEAEFGRAGDADDVYAEQSLLYWIAALASGTAGVGLLAMGGVVLLYESPLFKRRDAASQQP
ncbi:MAG: hypothetical protein CMJ31_04945 [Phycisphaerae bacterium]|nr:hypothetical protein [Phycisphaerae bacterium]